MRMPSHLQKVPDRLVVTLEVLKPKVLFHFVLIMLPWSLGFFEGALWTTAGHEGNSQLGRVPIN